MSFAAPDFEERQERRQLHAAPWLALPKPRRNAGISAAMTAADRGLIELFRGTGLRTHGAEQPDARAERLGLGTRADNPVQLLRTWTGLPMVELARMLRRSRRAVYDRLGGARGTPSNEAHEAWVLDLLGALTSTMDPPRLRRWLVSGEPPMVDLLAAGQTEAAQERVMHALAADLPQLRRLNANEVGPPVSTLSQPEIAAELSRFARSQPTRARERTRVPRELLFGDIDE